VQKDRNKELEAKVRESERLLSEEKSLRELTDSKLRALRKKLRAAKGEVVITQDTESNIKELSSGRLSRTSDSDRISRTDSDDIDWEFDTATAASGDHASVGADGKVPSTSRPTSPLLLTCFTSGSVESRKTAAPGSPSNEQLKKGSSNHLPQSVQKPHGPPLIPRKTASTTNGPSNWASVGTSGRGPGTARGSQSSPLHTSERSFSGSLNHAGDTSVAAHSGALKRESNVSHVSAHPMANMFDPHAPAANRDTGQYLTPMHVLNHQNSQGSPVLDYSVNSQNQPMHAVSQQQTGTPLSMQHDMLQQPKLGHTGSISDLQQPVVFPHHTMQGTNGMQHAQGMATQHNQYQGDQNVVHASQSTPWGSQTLQQHPNGGPSDMLAHHQAQTNIVPPAHQQSHDPFDDIVRRPSSSSHQTR
jgi:hypothetical protein